MKSSAFNYMVSQNLDKNDDVDRYSLRWLNTLQSKKWWYFVDVILGPIL